MTAGAQNCCIPALPAGIHPDFHGARFPGPGLRTQAGGWLRDTTQSRKHEPITQPAR
jgi:hypothetical protein